MIDMLSAAALFIGWIWIVIMAIAGIVSLFECLDKNPAPDPICYPPVRQVFTCPTCEEKLKKKRKRK